MNKIYNNLNIENLEKTEWFKQFNPTQQQQKRLGYEKGSLIDYINRVYDDSWLVQG